MSLELATNTALAGAGIGLAGLDEDLLKDMQESGFFTDEELAAIPTTVAPPASEVSEEEALKAAEHLEAEEERQALYAEQESTGGDFIEPENVVHEAGETDAPQPKTRKARASSSTPKAPRAPRVAAFSSAGAYVASVVGGEDVLLVDGSAATNVISLVDGIHAKKIKEKATNFFDHFHRGKPLSVFTRIALETLAQKGQLTAKDLASVYMSTNKGNGSKSDCFSQGTAASQSQQEVTLLRTLGLIASSGAAVPTSVYWKQYLSST